MPPKATTATKPAAKRSAPAEHPPYKEMIKEAIIALKDRNGTSRPALKKYLKANYKGVETDRFDSLFNQALKKGTDVDFTFPKGPSGTVKLAKKEPVAKAAKPAAKKTEKKTAEKKKPAAKPAAEKKAAPKKPATTTKKAATTTKKAATTTKKAAPKAAAAKPKANAKKPRKETAAAVPEEKKETVLTKTKSGRVSKTSAAKAAPKEKAAAAPKKKTTPKKKDA